MKTAAFSWSSTASYSIMSNGAKNLLGKDIASALIVIRKSSRTFGKIITKKFGSGCAAPTTPSRPRPFRYRTTFLEPAGRLAALCFRNQRPACVRNGSTATRSQGTRSRVHLLRGAGAEDLFQRRSTPATRTLPAHCAGKFGHESGHCRTRLLGNGFSGAG